MNFRVLFLVLCLPCVSALGMESGGKFLESSASYRRSELAKPLVIAHPNVKTNVAPQTPPRGDSPTGSPSKSSREFDFLRTGSSPEERSVLKDAEPISPAITDEQESPTLQDFLASKNMLKKDGKEDCTIVPLHMLIDREKRYDALPPVPFRKHQEGIGDALTVASKVAQGGLATMASFCWLNGNWVSGAIINGVNAKSIAKTIKNYGLGKQATLGAVSTFGPEFILQQFFNPACTRFTGIFSAIGWMSLTQSPLTHGYWTNKPISIKSVAIKNR